MINHILMGEMLWWWWWWWYIHLLARSCWTGQHHHQWWWWYLFTKGQNLCGTGRVLEALVYLTSVWKWGADFTSI